jgi:hypothetical protein
MKASTWRFFCSVSSSNRLRRDETPGQTRQYCARYWSQISALICCRWRTGRSRRPGNFVRTDSYARLKPGCTTSCEHWANRRKGSIVFTRFLSGRTGHRACRCDQTGCGRLRVQNIARGQWPASALQAGYSSGACPFFCCNAAMLSLT